MDVNMDLVEMFADWDAMTDIQKVDFCVQRAHQAMLSAQGGPQEVREQSLHDAQQWLDLANDISARNLPGTQLRQMLEKRLARSRKSTPSA